MTEMVNHPNHYNSFSFEVIDLIDEVASAYESDVSFSIGNTIKYMTRAPFKGNQVEDLKKAQWYLNHAIELLEGEQRE